MKNVYGMVSTPGAARCVQGLLAVWLFSMSAFASPTYAQAAIPVAEVPCSTCVTATDAQRAAAVYFNAWLGATPPGYSGVISNEGACTTPVLTNSTQLLVTTVTVGVDFVYGSCWRYPHGGAGQVLQTISIPSTSAYQSCLEATREGIPCSSLSYMNSGPPMTAPPSPTMPPMGTTVAQVDANFPSVILWGFQTNSGIDAQITNLPDSDLALLSHLYYMRTNGNIDPLLNLAAQKLSVPNLLRFEAAFGQAMNAAVNMYASNSVKAAYFAAPVPSFIPKSQSHYLALGLNAPTANGLASPSYIANPNWNMTLSEIWDEFYAAGTGTTALEATVLATKYVTTELGWSYAVGHFIGTGIYIGISYADPNFFNNLIDFFGAPWMDTVPGGTVVVGQPTDTVYPDSFVFHNWQYSGK